ncbi:MAG: trypsin-like serine protease [Spirosomataceae bacterium]
MDYSILHKISVRLSIENQPVGSGVILNNNNDLFLITARHCLQPNPTEFNIDFYDSDEKVFRTHTKQFPAPNEVYMSDSYQNDYLMIKLNREDVAWEIPEIKLALNITKLDEFKFKGFPMGHQGKFPSNIDVKTTDRTNKNFQLKLLNETFDNSECGFVDIVKGCSGSAVFLFVNEEIFLVGIILKYTERIVRFWATDISFIKDFVPEIKVYNENEIIVESVNIELIADFRRQLNESEEYIFKFKPLTALSEIEEIQKAIESCQLPPKNKKILLAECTYLKAIALIHLERQTEDASELLIKAYNSQPDNFKYQERAASGYYHLNNRQKALELVEKVLQEDELNPRAWALKETLSSTKIEVPNSVLKKPRFIYNRFVHSINGKKITEFQDVNKVYKGSELIPVPQTIELESYQYYIFLGIYFLHGDNYEGITIRKKTKQNETEFISEKIQRGVEILKKVVDTLSKTEMVDTILFNQAQYYYDYAKYKVKPEKRLALELLYKYSENDLISLQLMKVFDIVLALSEQNLHEEVIALIEKSKIEQYDPVFYILRAQSLQGLEQNQEANSYFEKYLTEVKNIDWVNTQNVLLAITMLLNAGFDTSTIHSTLPNKFYSEEYFFDLIEVFLFKQDKEKRDFCREKIERLLDNWNTFQPHYRLGIILSMYFIGEYERAKVLLEPDLDKKTEQVYGLYIQILLRLPKYNTELLKKLEFWRLHFTPNLDLLFHELNLYISLANYPKIEALCIYGLEKFKENTRLKFILIEVLYRQRKKVETFLDERLLDEKYSANDTLYLSRVCITNNKVEIGLEMAYRLLRTSPENLTIKQNYWGICLLAERYQETVFPEYVELNTYVELEINGELSIHSVNSDSLETNPIIQCVFKKSKLEVVELTTSFQANTPIRIVAIYDKYIGELRKIFNEATRPLASGLPLRSIELPHDNDILAITQLFQVEFGSDGLQQKLKNEEIFAEYENQQIGFTDICLSIFDGNVLDCFDSLTQNPQLGINLIPFINQTPPHISNTTTFVLDITSICLFYKLANEIDFTGKKLAISQYTKDLIIYEIDRLKSEPEEKFSISILPDKVTPIFYPEHYNRNRIIEFEKILSWVEANCQIEYPEYALDLFSEDSVLLNGSANSLYQNYITNTLLITHQPNKILVTDDLFLLKQEIVPRTTSEVFLKIQSIDDWEKAKVKMVELNYKGLTLTKDTLVNVFNKSRILSRNKPNLFQYALKNLQGSHNPNRENVMQALEFIKYLFAENLELTIKESTTKQVFIAILSEPYFDIIQSNLELLNRIIDKKLELLGNAPTVVKECLNEVIRLLFVNSNTNPK